MAEVGTYYITVMPEMSGFTGKVKSALGSAGEQGGKSFSTSFGDIVKGSAIGVALGNLASKAGSAIMSGLTTGIGRLDTLENFPRVMESLGFKSEEAAVAIEDIRNRLRGLPTATQDVVRLTQAIADSTGDLGLAKDAALGFNDMLLASGASTGEVTQATGVLNRILGKQNATVAQWQSLNSVMPAQMAAVAREMLGEGASVEELRDKLNDGTVSWNDFLGAIVKLDNEGTGKVKSFREQAEANSVGIGTAIQNVQNRIGDGWAEVLKQIGQKNISDAISDMADLARGGLYVIADAVGYLAGKIGETDIVKNLGELGETIGGVFSGFLEDGGSDMLKGFADAAVSFIDGVLQWLVDNKDLVVAAIGGIVGAVTAIMGWNIGVKLAALPGAISAINAALMANPLLLIATAIAAVVMALYTFFTQTETGKKIWENFTGALKDLWEGLKADWATLCEVFTREWESFKAFIDGIPEWWQGVVDYWSNAIDEFCGYLTEAWEKVKSDLKQAWDDLDAKLNAWVDGISTAISTWCDNTWNTITTTWENIKTTVAETVTSIKEGLQSRWEAIKTMVADKVLHLAAAIYKTFGEMRETIHEKVEAVRERLVNGFQAMHDKAVEIVEGVKTSIVEKFEYVKEKISGVVDWLKGIFDFEWKLPDIELPHFSVTEGGGPLGLPSISVDWYAKGGVFDTAAIIGIGEAGREAALPLNDATYREIANGIAEQGGAGGGVVIKDCTFNVREDSDIDRIADALSARWMRDMGAIA